MQGPYSKNLTLTEWKVSNPNTGAGAFCRTLYKNQTWYRSGTIRRHARKPLPYSMKYGVVDGTSGRNQTCDAANQLAYTTMGNSKWNNFNNLVSNRALAKFVSDAQGVAQASLGETLGEWKDSLDTITSRLAQLANAARELRRGNVPGCARALGLTKDSWGKTTRKRVKSFGDQWLEFHLGWVPLISDIYNACDAISREPYPQTAVGRASATDFTRTLTNFPSSRYTDEVNYKFGRRVQGYVVVVNPNEALLASMGLANPLSVAWALVPYSFVVDWFVDLGGFIGALDGLLGCSTSDAFYTTLQVTSSRERAEYYDNFTSSWKLNALITSRGCSCVRTLGLPPHHLTYINAPRFSWQRGATAIALLLKYL